MNEFPGRNACACLLLLIGSCAARLPSVERQATPVASTGETIVKSDYSGANVRITIATHEVDIGEPSAPRPEVIHSNCTYSRVPCSIVDFIDIFVGGERVRVPHSVYSDLSDLNTASIHVERNGFVLLLEAGDASESYEVKIIFGAGGVSRRIRWSAFTPDSPSEETIYYPVETFGDQ